MLLARLVKSPAIKTTTRSIPVTCSPFSTTVVSQALANRRLRNQHLNYRLIKIDRSEARKQQLRAERMPDKKPPRNAYKKKPAMRGHPRDEEDVRISKTVSWLLRHGAKTEGLNMRPDGYVQVQELLALPRLQTVDISTLERIVQHDPKERYHLLFEPSTSGSGTAEDIWWIRANQGHSMKDVDLNLSEITDAGQVPMAVHGTNLKAWEKIEQEGLSPMNRTHIHLAKHHSHIKGIRATPGLRDNSQILIYVDVDRALRAGIHFYLSANGVVLTKGDETGFLSPKFFQRVEDAYGEPLEGWSGVRAQVLNRKNSKERSTEREAIEHQESGDKLEGPSNLETPTGEIETSRLDSTGEVVEETPSQAAENSEVVTTTEALSDINLKVV